MEFRNFAKTQGPLIAKVAYSLILKIQDTTIIAAKFSIFSKQFLPNCPIFLKLAQGNLPVEP